MKSKNIFPFFLAIFLLLTIEVSAVVIPNPLSGDFLSYVKKISSIIRPLTILTFVAVVIWGGLKIETAGNKSENVSAGFKIIAAGIVGLIIMFLAPSLPDFFGMILNIPSIIDF